MSCSEWLLNTLAVEPFEKLAQIATILWGIWSARNLKVWQNKMLTTQMAMQSSVLQVKQWRDSQKLKLARSNMTIQANKDVVVKWRSPDEGRLKINVDAHIVLGNPWFSCGLVLRDHGGNFIAARARRFAGVVPVVEAEAIAILEATRWASLLDLQHVDVESDSLISVQAINKTSENYLEAGVVFQECRDVLRARSDIVLSFIKKQANKVAHSVARVPCDVNCFVDFSTPPHSVLEYLVSDNLMD
ncbi:uncharacterized protein LOC141660115 [Apium graveolens]|uniref:uncharacterized protein LOC141660115 n=1 Tax=Apium graveolens TaxID=4045 RepID=UPI003D79F600